ncbi:MAG: DUF2948 family protein [Alphaproteobacteria bacterium]|nr:DUF2948 family protein [Alphaproteobacteria bacterium]
MPTGKLKLMAGDAADLQVISAAIQDALVAVKDCAFLGDERRFAMLVNRYRWEAEQVSGQGSRTHAALVFNEVTGVRHRNVPLGQPDRVLELLAVVEDGPGTVRLDFAADRSIRLEMARLACHLEDVGEPWPTPWKPAHPV